MIWKRKLLDALKCLLNSTESVELTAPATTLSNRLTMLQQRPSEVPPIPGQEKSFSKSAGIDLGTRYASQLGFDGIKLYEEDDASAPAEPTATGSNKKKKKRKKKRGGEKKEADVDDEGGDE